MKNILLIILLCVSFSSFSRGYDIVKNECLLELRRSSDSTILTSLNLDVITWQNTSSEYGFQVDDGISSFSANINHISNFTSVDSLFTLLMTWKLSCQTGSNVRLNGDTLIVGSDTVIITGGSAQTLTLLTKNDTSQSISISGGNTIALDIRDLDSDATNEIQTLSKSNDTIYLEDGGFVITDTSLFQFFNNRIAQKDSNQIKFTKRFGSETVTFEISDSASELSKKGLVAAGLLLRLNEGFGEAFIGVQDLAPLTGGFFENSAVLGYHRTADANHDFAQVIVNENGNDVFIGVKDSATSVIKSLHFDEVDGLSLDDAFRGVPLPYNGEKWRVGVDGNMHFGANLGTNFTIINQDVLPNEVLTIMADSVSAEFVKPTIDSLISVDTSSLGTPKEGYIKYCSDCTNDDATIGSLVIGNGTVWRKLKFQ